MNFGKRDLGLVLSETIGDADTLRFTKDSRWVYWRQPREEQRPNTGYVQHDTWCLRASREAGS